MTAEKSVAILQLLVLWVRNVIETAKKTILSHSHGKQLRKGFPFFFFFIDG